MTEEEEQRKGSRFLSNQGVRTRSVTGMDGEQVGTPRLDRRGMYTAANTDEEPLKPGGYYSIGANPPPAWSNYIGPEHKAPPPVATQLVVPTDLSDGPVDLTCVHCQHHVTTRVKSGPSMLTWGFCACLCMFLCWPCACLPFCSNRLKVTRHFCSNCGILLGVYKGWKGKADP